MKKIFLVLFIFILLLFADLSLAGARTAVLESRHFLISSQVSSDGSEVLRIAEEAYPEIVNELGFRPKTKIKIYVFRGYSLFVRESGYKGGGEIAGLAKLPQNQIFICSSVGNLGTTVIHELSHIIFLQSIPDPSKIPFWFIEGLAIYQSDPTLETADLEELALEGDLPTISSLGKKKISGFSKERETAAQGYLAVSFIAERYGQDKLYGLVRRLQSGQNFETALEQATGANQADLERVWRGYVEQTWRETLWSTLRYLGWTLLPVLVILAVIVWFIRRKKKLEKLDEDDFGEASGRD